MLWHCEFAQRVWATCSVILPARMEIQMSVVDFVSCCLRDLDSTNIAILLYTAWTLWLARNELKWEGKVSTIVDICN